MAAKPPLPEGFFLVDKLLDKRKVGTRVEYFVTWQGYSLNDASWEPRASLLETCPNVVKDFEEELKLNQKKQTSSSAPTEELIDVVSVPAPTASSSTASASVLSSSAPKRRGRPPTRKTVTEPKAKEDDSESATSAPSITPQKRSSPLRSSETPATTADEANTPNDPPRKRGRPRKIQPVLVSEPSPASDAFALAASASTATPALPAPSAPPSTTSVSNSMGSATIAGILSATSKTTTSSTAAAIPTPVAAQKPLETPGDSTFAKPHAPVSSPASASLRAEARGSLLGEHLLRTATISSSSNTASSSLSSESLPQPHPSGFAGLAQTNVQPHVLHLGATSVPQTAHKSPAKLGTPGRAVPSNHLVQSILRAKPQERIDTLFTAPVALPLAPELLAQSAMSSAAASSATTTTSLSTSSDSVPNRLAVSKTIEDLLNPGIVPPAAAAAAAHPASTSSSAASSHSHPIAHPLSLSPKKRLVPSTPPKLEKSDRLIKSLLQKNNELAAVSSSSASLVTATSGLPAPLSADYVASSEKTQQHAPQMFSGYLDLLKDKRGATASSSASSSPSGTSPGTGITTPPSSPPPKSAKKKKDEFVEIVSESPSHPKLLTPSQREALLERQRIVGGVPIFDNGSQSSLDWGLSQDNNSQSALGDSGNALASNNNNNVNINSALTKRTSGPILTWDNSNDRRALTGSNSSNESSMDVFNKLQSFEESLSNTKMSADQIRLAQQKLKDLAEKLSRKASV